jgi:hypothetical protein
MSDFTDDTEGTWQEGGLVPDDAQLYEAEDGQVYAVDDAGTQWFVEDAPVDQQTALEDVFVAANDGNVEAGQSAYDNFEDQFAAAHGVGQDDEGYLSSSELDSWLADNPIVEANGGLAELLPYYEAAGDDLDGAVELLNARVEQDRKAAAKLGYRPGGEKKLTMEEAVSSAFEDGLLGAKGRKPYVHKPTGDAMGDAMGEMQEALSLQNAVTRQSEQRVRKAARRSG